MPGKLGEMKRIVIKEEYCIGCRLCEVWCIVAHSSSKDIIKTYQEEERPLSAIYFEEKGHISFALQCRHCPDPPCIYACLTGALYKDEGKVLHNKDKCVGCWMCIMSCPCGAIKQDIKNKKVASKCDLCVSASIPACVEHCPNGAITLK